MKKVSKVEAKTEAAVVAIGLDVGDRWSHWCAVSDAGEVVSRGRVASTAEALREQAAVWSGVRVALENGTHSGWMSRVLKACGSAVVVANPSRWRGTAHNAKNDRNDAEALARTVRLDPRLLFPIEHRSEQSQQDLAVIRVRAQLVKTRTLLVNTARGTVKSLGYRLAAGSADYFVSTTWKQVPVCLHPALAPLYKTLRALNAQIAELDQRIATLSTERYPETRRLTTVPGIGRLTALTYVLTLGGKDRFSNSREAGAYLGLRPKQRQSGERDPELGIAKNGDSYLRSLLVECAHHVLRRGPDSALKRWGLSLSNAGTRARKRALVAVARKLAVLLHRLWTTGEDFRPFPNPQPLEGTVDAEVRVHRSLQPATATM